MTRRCCKGLEFAPSHLNENFPHPQLFNLNHLLEREISSLEQAMLATGGGSNGCLGLPQTVAEGLRTESQLDAALFEAVCRVKQDVAGVSLRARILTH